MADESRVTIAAARFLGKADWPVVSLALPSGGSGVTLRSRNTEDPVLVPDIVARSQDSDRAIVVEAKPAFSASDAAKLISLKSGTYEESINRTLSLTSKDLILCLAHSGNPVRNYESFGIDLVLTLMSDREIRVSFDRLGLFR